MTFSTCKKNPIGIEYKKAPKLTYYLLKNPIFKTIQPAPASADPAAAGESDGDFEALFAQLASFRDRAAALPQGSDQRREYAERVAR